jgi:hypothetical protein
MEHNLFNHQLVAYRAAQARLVRYRLADGRPEVTEEQQAINAQGQSVFDEETDYPAIEAVAVQVAIDPLPAEIEQPVYAEATGEQTGTIMVPNPAVVRDDAERAAARAVIDGTPTEVIAFAKAEEAVGA